MTLDPSPSGQLTLGDILAAAGMDDLTDVLVIRHTPDPEHMPDVRNTTPEAVLAYTRDQDASHRSFPKSPPKHWLVFMEDGSYEGAHRSRFYGAFENAGEALDERTETNRRFHISPTPVLNALKNRLVVDWTTPRRWHRRGVLAGEFRVIEIADPQVIPFVGYDKVRLTYSGLQQVVADPHYSRWQSALSSVKGIYLITDTSNGKHYVGKADGFGGVLARWAAYASDGHGSNKELVNLPKHQCEHFFFSILTVFEPRTLQTQVDAAETHYKIALRSREFGYNLN